MAEGQNPKAEVDIRVNLDTTQAEQKARRLNEALAGAGRVGGAGAAPGRMPTREEVAAAYRTGGGRAVENLLRRPGAGPGPGGFDELAFQRVMQQSRQVEINTLRAQSAAMGVQARAEATLGGLGGPPGLPPVGGRAGGTAGGQGGRGQTPVWVQRAGRVGTVAGSGMLLASAGVSTITDLIDVGLPGGILGMTGRREGRIGEDSTRDMARSGLDREAANRAYQRGKVQLEVERIEARQDRDRGVGDVNRQEQRDLAAIGRQYRDIVKENELDWKRFADERVKSEREVLRIREDWGVQERDFARQRADESQRFARFEEDLLTTRQRRQEDIATEAAGIERDAQRAGQDLTRDLGRLERDRGRFEANLADVTGERQRDLTGAREDLSFGRLSSAFGIMRAARSGDPLALLGAIHQRRQLARRQAEIEERVSGGGFTAREQRDIEATREGFGERREDYITSGTRRQEDLRERQRLMRQGEARGAEDDLMAGTRAVEDTNRNRIRQAEDEAVANRARRRQIDDVGYRWDAFVQGLWEKTDALNVRIGDLNLGQRETMDDAERARTGVDRGFRRQIRHLGQEGVALEEQKRERDRALTEREEDIRQRKRRDMEDLEIARWNAVAQSLMGFGFNALFAGGPLKAWLGGGAATAATAGGALAAGGGAGATAVGGSGVGAAALTAGVAAVPVVIVGAAAGLTRPTGDPNLPGPASPLWESYRGPGSFGAPITVAVTVNALDHADLVEATKRAVYQGVLEAARERGW